MAKARTTRPRASTITDVAREARVSVASVSRVVNGHANVTPQTRQRIVDAVDRLRYVPDTAARSLITKRTHVIGVLLPDLYGGFFSELIRGIDAEARRRQLHLLLSSSHGNTGEMAAAIRGDARPGRGPAAARAPARPGELDAMVPTVFMNSRVDDGVSSSLWIDSYGGARAMVRHLVARGHRSIAHVAGPSDNFDSHERERGYRDELAAALPAAVPVVQYPRLHFVRIGDEIEIGYDNRGCLIDGVPVWAAQIGAYRISVEAFAAAVTEVSTALLDAMAERIDDLDRGRAMPQAPIEVASLREQHATWDCELSDKFGPSQPDVSWDETLAALTALGATTGPTT
jgi:Family of unknown function (DUF5984)/Bacterial regulatory proteins, lacI family/Periplasmic binding protein-like domain